MYRFIALALFLLNIPCAFAYGHWTQYMHPEFSFITKRSAVYQDGNRQYMVQDTKRGLDSMESLSEYGRKYARMKDQLRGQMRAAIANELRGKASLDQFTFNINGPMKVKVVGNSNGTFSAQIGGFKVYAKAKASKSIFAKATVEITSGTIFVDADYDPYNGQLTPRFSQSIRDSIRVSVDVDSFFDFIPLFNSWVTNKLEDDLENQLKHYINNSINSNINKYNRKIFALDDYLEDGTLILSGVDTGVPYKDLGKYIKQAVSSLSGKFIELSVSGEELDLYNNPEIWHEGTVQLNISNKVILTVEDKYQPQWRCLSTTCPLPPTHW
ncbi:hypothetical protein PRUB_a2459 [Pseudoalteromonas rubra]|uniref:Uncharacterized protein n=1 Tax=Pseudoalteromonas rubra TaxID=43658 RepID=A0A8T0CBH8_9GAMM|nr:hypothetical protein [Pseudoalteromonas rubra]KAF7787930.1 hypothetical protein PRUB_a2459 [Pseudoalteromonas rubra]